jgi:hypothetical protein
MRERLGLNVIQMGRALGYEGKGANVSRDMRRYESYRESLPPGVRLRVEVLRIQQADLIEALAKPRPRMR